MDTVVGEVQLDHSLDQAGQDTYDVFISYNEADRDWVSQELLPRLEQAGLRVAIDYDSFIAGMPHLDNIEQAIEHSHLNCVIWVAFLIKQ